MSLKKGRPFEIIRTSDVKKYIIMKYHSIPSRKFEIVKISTRTYIYLVNQNNNLAVEPIYVGQLSLVNKHDYLKRYLESNIEKALKKHGYLEV